MSSSTPHSRSIKEFIFQVILHVIVFIFYAFDRHNPELKPAEVVAFLSYAVAVLVVNYVLLPKYLYTKMYMVFGLTFMLVIVGVIAFEEFILEPIFYPDTRALRFPGVFFSLLGVMPVITILSGFKFAWDLIYKQIEIEELKTLVQESELKFLKSQIHPHFLFNNLNNLYAYALEQSPKTPQIIVELSAVLRYMLYECQEKYVPLSKELEQLENFVRLNELQIEERGKVSFNLPDLKETDFQIAPLMLIVFVENAFKHSMGSQSEEIMIHIDISVGEDGHLLFVCENSCRQETNQDNVAKGIGLENVKQRLEYLYPEKYQLTVDEQPEFYQMKLEIDLT